MPDPTPPNANLEYEPPRYYTRHDGVKVPLKPDHIVMPDGSKLPISDYRYGPWSRSEGKG